MTQKDFFSLSLPKWPALLVKGEPVTQDQAREILIRTDSLIFCSNDREFEKYANLYVYGVEADFLKLTDAVKGYLNTDEWDKAYAYEQNCRNELGVIDLHYLNNHRIISSYIGGPHGWCTWNGNIGCNDYNIGKWPTVEAVFQEWKLIAETFPYLDLRSQLLDGESSQDNVLPVVEFVVRRGKVKMIDPKHKLDNPNFDARSAVMNLFSPGRERGISLPDLYKNIRYVREVVEKEKKKKKNETV